MIITIANIKGGSTKSVTAIYLAEALSRRGRTLVCDLDPQADLTDFFLPDVAPREISSANALTLLKSETSLGESVRTAEFADILPAVIELAEINSEARRNLGAFLRLKQELKKAKQYSHVVIDTPGAIGLELTAALIAADVVVIPCTPSKWTVRAVGLVMGEIKAAEKAGGKKRIFILPAMFGKSAAHQDLLSELRSTGFAILPEIPRSASIQARSEKGEPLSGGSAPWESFEALAEALVP